MSAARQPVIFVPHGGGPCFWIEFPPPFGPHAWDGLRDYLAGLVTSLPERPKAFLVVTAHWEADKPTVSVNPKPGMLYDYYGFPEHTYKLSYPAPGEPGAGGGSQAAHRGGGPAGRDRRRARLRPRRVRALPHRRSEGRDPGRHAVAAQGSRSRLPHQARQGARAVARSGRRDRRQRHELSRPPAFPRRRHDRLRRLRRLARRDGESAAGRARGAALRTGTRRRRRASAIRARSTSCR